MAAKKGGWENSMRNSIVQSLISASRKGGVTIAQARRIGEEAAARQGMPIEAGRRLAREIMGSRGIMWSGPAERVAREALEKEGLQIESLVKSGKKEEAKLRARRALVKRMGDFAPLGAGPEELFEMADIFLEESVARESKKRAEKAEKPHIIEIDIGKREKKSPEERCRRLVRRWKDLAEKDPHKFASMIRPLVGNMEMGKIGEIRLDELKSMRKEKELAQMEAESARKEQQRLLKERAEDIMLKEKYGVNVIGGRERKKGARKR